MDNVRKETHVVSVTDPHLETDAWRDEKNIRPLHPAPEAKAQTDGETPSKGSNSEGESPSWTRGRLPCRGFLGTGCTNPSCNLWHPPVWLMVNPVVEKVQLLH